MSALDGKTEIKQEVKAVKESTENITLTKSELQNIISQAVAAASSAAQDRASEIVSKGMSELAAAIIESKKPYVDPRQEENERAMRESMRVVNERMKAQILASQATCPHLQGSSELSDFSGQLSSLVIHRLDSGVVVGICTNCQKQIYSDDPDVEVQKIFRMKSGNRMSSAGIRNFVDPKAAMAAGRLTSSK
jgi:type III secretion system FlhB-like substrate exporter